MTEAMAPAKVAMVANRRTLLHRYVLLKAKPSTELKMVRRRIPRPLPAKDPRMPKSRPCRVNILLVLFFVVPIAFNMPISLDF